MNENDMQKSSILNEMESIEQQLLEIKSVFQEWTTKNKDPRLKLENKDIWEIAQMTEELPANTPFLEKQKQRLVSLFKRLAFLEYKLKALTYREIVHDELDKLRGDN